MAVSRQAAVLLGVEMFARVKEDCRLPAVRACGGVMFVKAEWTEVPSEHTLDALTHEMLEIKPVEVVAEVVPAAPTPPPMFSVGGKKGGKR